MDGAGGPGGATRATLTPGGTGGFRADRFSPGSGHWQLVVGEPGAHFLVDGGVVEELGGDKAAEGVAVADSERDVVSASAPVGAGGFDEQVPEELAQGSVWAT